MKINEKKLKKFIDARVIFREGEFLKYTQNRRWYKQLSYLYEEILLDTTFLSEEASISQRVYTYLYDMLDNPKCVCDKYVKYNNLNKGYNIFCSSSCAAKIILNSPEVRKRNEQSKIKSGTYQKWTAGSHKQEVEKRRHETKLKKGTYQKVIPLITKESHKPEVWVKRFKTMRENDTRLGKIGQSERLLFKFLYLCGIVHEKDYDRGIVDFKTGRRFQIDIVVKDLGLAIEIDGDGHQNIHDHQKDSILKRIGWKVLRINMINLSEQNQIILMKDELQKFISNQLRTCKLSWDYYKKLLKIRYKLTYN